MKKELWVHRDYGYEIRVMARAEGHVMVRRKGAAPFLLSESHLTTIYKPIAENEKHAKEGV